jgi:hypothetical protein
MTRTQKEIPAGRIQPTSFDSELPPDARLELLSPKRPRILGDRKPLRPGEVPRRGNFAWPALAAILISLFAAGLALRPQPKRQPPIKTMAAIPTPAQVQEPAPKQTAPAVISAPNAPAFQLPPPASLSQEPLPELSAKPLTLPTTALRRAELVKSPEPPAPRAIRILHPGDSVPVTMPYRIQVLATVRAALSSTDQLPTSGNHVGDLWLVGTTPWIWIAAPGAPLAWVDP